MLAAYSALVFVLRVFRGGLGNASAEHIALLREWYVKNKDRWGPTAKTKDVPGADASATRQP